MTFRRSIAAIGAVVLVAGGVLAAWWHRGSEGSVTGRVDFSRDIRPIFNQSCTSCHGGVRQKNGVSFIYREEALGVGKSGRPTIVPGHPERSELIARLTATDPEARMPYHAPPLLPQQIALLKRWIKEGAQWQDHWAFVAPRPQPLPAVKHSAWPRQPEDRFILARLEKEGLEPSPEATKTALLRRVSLDLTGLPPTPEALASFLTDGSADAYEKQVDRLLASPRYGERWAALWLDLARYADSRGYEHDTDRPMWPYRDWVIDAFNRNLPYDRFVITQLAGDLLPKATYDDLIATSFQRQTPLNDEGGIDDEEFRLVSVMDRVATTWATLNGLTINCVQCHSHPYDPIRHVEYYKFLAFYNASRDGNLIDDSPTLSVPLDPTKRGEVAGLELRRGQLLKEIVDAGRVVEEQTRWTALPIENGLVNRTLGLNRYIAQIKSARDKGINARVYFGETRADGVRSYYDGLITQSQSNLEDVRRAGDLQPLHIEKGEVHETAKVIPMPSVLELKTGTLPSSISAIRFEVPPLDPVKARHTPDEEFNVDCIDAWVVSPSGREEKINFRYFAPDTEENLATALRTEGRPVKKADAPLPSLGTGGFASDVKVFQTRWIVGIPEKPLVPEPGARLKLQLTNTLIVRGKSATPKRVRIETSPDGRWGSLASDPGISDKLAAIKKIDHRLAQIPAIPLPVMAEEPAYARHDTLEFERGNFLNKIGPALAPDVPALFPKLPKNAPRNRLTMAQWFFAPGQPLTARVAANRYWEQLFGTGLVETLEDFGSAGQPPSHPELLDWMALHFQNDLHWNMKALLRELVTSATYRQDNKIALALLQKDPRNRLLAHGPQQRLSAEMVRDQALSASGLLNLEMGGPPVMPPQPPGLWMSVGNSSQWVDSVGPESHRRAIYTYLKRGTLYPSLVTFDAADHVVTLARRIPTNTPLQALVTLNDPVYQEAAEALARRMLGFAQANGVPLEGCLNFGAQLVLSRDLFPEEQAVLQSLYEDAGKMTRASAITIANRSGGQSVGKADLKAMAAVASALFNLDAALTR